MRPLTAFLLLLGAAHAAAPPAEPDDAHDLIILHPKRPYRLRLHLRSHGRSFQAGWHHQVSRLFRHLDANNDGRLSPAELALAPGREQLLQITSGDRTIDPEAAPALADVARGKPYATLADLDRYYANATSGPLQVRWRQRPTVASDALGDELWRALVPAGHPLTVARARAATRLTERYDSDEDETVSGGELMGSSSFFDQPRPYAAGKAHGPAGYGLPFFSARPDGLTAEVETHLKAKYRAVPAGWRSAAPDLVVVLEYGRAAVPVVRHRAEGLWVQPTRGGLQIAVEGWLLQLGLDVDLSGAVGRRENALALFRGQDTDGNGYLDKREIYRHPFQYVSWLRLADRDGDGKITRREFTDLAELVGGLNGQVTMLRVADLGPSLFRIVDVDADGRLSRRELAEAWRHLGPGLAKGYPPRGLPHVYRVSVGHDRALPLAADPSLGRLRPLLPARGPLWFRKMDRNGDGDVSRVEWLGTREEFDRIDTDGDGLLGVEEAEAYDRLRRRGGK